MYEDKVWLTVSETAEYARCSEDTIRRWLNDPKHPLRGSKFTTDGPWLVKRAIVDAILESRTGEPNEGAL